MKSFGNMALAKGVPRQHCEKKLLFSNAMVQEVCKATATKYGKNKKLAPKIIAGGKIMKKYRLLNILSSETGLTRRSLQVKACVAERKSAKLKQQLRRMMPGKADFKMVDGVKQQKRYLNDYMNNLFLKFKAENPTVKISRSLFCQLPPKHILTTSFTSRNTCLCQRHQNMALKLRSLKAMSINASTSPDVFVSSCDGEALDNLLNKCHDTVKYSKYSQWKRVEVDDKKNMKILEFQVSKAEFVKIFKEETKKFEAHAYRVKIQYCQLKDLKANLPDGHVIIHMDFAEN